MKIAVLGASGYAGLTLIHWLCRHPEAEIKLITSNQYAGDALHSLDGRFYNQMLPLLSQHERIIDQIDEIDFIFLALPHGVSKTWVEKLRPYGKPLVDLSGDYRLDAKTYQDWYQEEHLDLVGLEMAHYGLATLFEVPKGHQLTANPGCYPTASILALAPLVKAGLIDLESIVIDAKSGASGAGRSASISSLYCEVNETIRAYGVCAHRHTPEIEKILSRLADQPVMVQFTPHLVPMQHGLLASCYAKLKRVMTEAELLEIYRDFYHDKPFVRVIEGLPETRWVIGSNDADISVRIDGRTGRVMAFCAIDNTVLGAAGQAIQNMNLMMGWPQTLGLKTGKEG